MTYGEEKVLCACITAMILVLAAGIAIGFRIPRELFAEPAKSEQWFLKEAADIYTLSLEWYGGNPDGEARKRLSGMIERYNREAGKIRRWKYRCPPRFSLRYLGIEEER